jgi:FtsP/CotA-like multicopper oxidase with cupredoxin domain
MARAGVRREPPIPNLLVDEEVPANRSLLGVRERRKSLARIIFEGERMAMSLPGGDALKGLKPLRSITDDEVKDRERQTALYGIVGGTRTQFTISGQEYDLARSRKLLLGVAQEWTIGTRKKNLGTEINHPFHDVNPFELISTKDENGEEHLTELYWKDTILMPENGTITIRTRYERYIGSFVRHYQILEHEDQEMMEPIEIVR